MKRILLLLLALTFIVGSIASCKKKPDASSETTTANTQTNTTPEDELSDIEKRALEKMRERFGDFIPSFDDA